jgi:hypothetical protein
MDILDRLKFIIGDNMDIEEGSSITHKVPLDDLRIAIREIYDLREKQFQNDIDAQDERQGELYELEVEYTQLLEAMDLEPLEDHELNLISIAKLITELKRKKANE